MGTFAHEITLLAPNGSGSETVSALVDTGATFTSIPSTLLERLGVIPQRSVRLRLATGEIVEQQTGEVVVALDGVRATVLCVFGPPDAPPLIGAHTLEAFLMAADPIEQRIVPTEALWL